MVPLHTQKVLLISLLTLLFFTSAASAQLINPSDVGFDGESVSDNYDTLLSVMLGNDKVVTSVNGKMWVPWHDTSAFCSESTLQRGRSCNADGIGWDKNCMVTDEYSQVGILVAMGEQQNKMDEFYNTLNSIKSPYGSLPSWRTLREGNTIHSCYSKLNNACDSASDASARIVLALFIAAKNPSFSSSAQSKYYNKAVEMANDMMKYEVRKECHKSDLGYGDICYWLAGGGETQWSGLGATNFAYTGYFGDATIAFLAACANTGDLSFCEAAEDFTLNYLQAADWDGHNFRVPPGLAFKWTNLDGVPKASCTHTCGPVQWDDKDAPRAIGMCQALYYGRQIGYDLPALERYCDQWESRHVQNPIKIPLQYRPDGSSLSAQHGYFAQGLQAMFYAGTNEGKFQESLYSALDHYTPHMKTWDYSACFGVYTQAMPMRALGFALGRDAAAFPRLSGTEKPSIPDGAFGAPPSKPEQPSQPENDEPEQTTEPSTPPPAAPAPVVDTGDDSWFGELKFTCTVAGQSCSIISDRVLGECRSISASSSHGNVKMQACKKPNNVVEIYRQDHPSRDDFEMCLAGVCVDNLRGWNQLVYLPNDNENNEPIYIPPEYNENENYNSGSGGSGGSSFRDISKLSFSCHVFGLGCTVYSDETEDSCRTIKASSPLGSVQVMACQKPSGVVEIYRQRMPFVPFEACVEHACVDLLKGYSAV